MRSTLSDERRCTAKSKRSGERCKRAAIVGGSTCAMHGSSTRRAKKAAARRVAEVEAARAVATLGLPVDVSPTEALLEEVRWTAGHVQWLRGRVQELDELPRDDEGRHGLVWGETEHSVKVGGDDHGDKTVEKAAPSVWYELYTRERKHLVDVCAAALRAGVEERRVRIAEQQGDLIAEVIRRILADLRLTPAQAALVGEVVPRHLRAIGGVA